LTVVPRDVPVAPVYVAQTQSSQAVTIAARVSGFLDKRVYTEGSVVKAGQVLFRMDQKPFQAQVDAAAAALQRNQAALEVAQANLARTKPLAEQNALSQKDLDDAQGQYEQAAAAVAQSKAQLESAQLDLSYTTITSPVDGISSFAAVADGTYVNPQNSQLTTVSVLTPMWVNFSVSENEMERIRNEVRTGELKLPEGSRYVVELEMVDGNLFLYTGRSPSRILRTTRRPARSCCARPSTTPRACCARTSTCARACTARSGRTRSSFRSARCSRARKVTSSGSSRRTGRRSCGRWPSATGTATAGSSRRAWLPATGSSSTARSGSLHARQDGTVRAEAGFGDGGAGVPAARGDDARALRAGQGDARRGSDADPEESHASHEGRPQSDRRDWLRRPHR
jgi:biotin carboxyl carrier protein